MDSAKEDQVKQVVVKHKEVNVEIQEKIKKEQNTPKNQKKENSSYEIEEKIEINSEKGNLKVEKICEEKIKISEEVDYDQGYCIRDNQKNILKLINNKTPINPTCDRVEALEINAERNGNCSDEIFSCQILESQIINKEINQENIQENTSQINNTSPDNQCLNSLCYSYIPVRNPKNWDFLPECLLVSHSPLFGFAINSKNHKYQNIEDEMSCNS
jgi:hypothetical protein